MQLSKVLIIYFHTSLAFPIIKLENGWFIKISMKRFCFMFLFCLSYITFLCYTRFRRFYFHYHFFYVAKKIFFKCKAETKMQTLNNIILNHTTLSFVFSLTILIPTSLVIYTKTIHKFKTRSLLITIKEAVTKTQL